MVLTAHENVHFSFTRYSTTYWNAITYEEADAMTREELAANVTALDVYFPKTRNPSETKWLSAGRVTNTDVAIWAMLLEGNTAANGFRPLRPTVVILTDGDATEKDGLMYATHYMHGTRECGLSAASPWWVQR